MEWEDVEAVVIGAGVVGLAVAREMAMAGLAPLVLEKNARLGEETSSRNSEVIHAGIYYEPGSLKARLCVEGKRALYAFCAARGVPHRACGKLIVACEPGERAALERISSTALAAGVTDLRLLERSEARALEPALSAEAALLSPSTGIVDSHAFMLALAGEAEAHGAQIVRNATVLGGEATPDGRLALRVGGLGWGEIGLRARRVVNAAGLWAQDVAQRLEGLDPASIPPRRLAKGSYFRLSGRGPFSRLVYPAPGGGGLGVHLTLDLAGRARFGPDVEWLESADPADIDYAVDPNRARSFYAAIRRYWPSLPDGALAPDYAGVRPKLARADGQNVDFRIDGEERHGLPGHVMLYGVESPGLTASLAIAREVMERVAVGSPPPAKPVPRTSRRGIR